MKAPGQQLKSSLLSASSMQESRRAALIIKTYQGALDWESAPSVSDSCTVMTQ